MTEASETIIRGEPPAADGGPVLERSLKSRHVAMIAIGGIIGAGLFVGSSTSIATVGPAVIVSYALAGFLVLLVMRMLGEMAMANPGVQSFPEFARIGVGEWAGFVSGWLYWYFWVVVVAVEAIAGATIVQHWLPMFQTWQIGVALMAVMTGVNLMSARSYGEFEFWLSSIKVGAIIAFIVIAGAYVCGIGSPGGARFGALTAYGGFMPHGTVSVLAGVTSVIFALCGAEIATVAAAESAASAKVVARLTAAVAGRILVFYILSITLIVMVVPWTAVVPGVSPFATALGAMHVPGAAQVMSFIVLVAVLSCLNSGLYVTSRVLFALAARGDAPRSLVALSRRQVPARSILIASLFSYAALAASVASPQRVFSFLVNASGALMLVIYLLLAIAQLRLRARLERDDPARLQIRMWLHPWGSYLAIAGMVSVLAAMALTPALASQFYASLMLLAIVAVAAAVRNSRRPARA
jgi:GABA permease